MEVKKERVVVDNGKWKIIFANEPSEEAIQAYSDEVNRLILEHILKEGAIKKG